MKKIKYKDQNKKNYKKIIIVLFVMIFILLLVNNYLSKLENDDNQVVEYDQLSSIKDVIAVLSVRAELLDLRHRGI